MQRIARRSLLAAAPAALTLAAWPARAAPQYDPGASDTEIKIGNIMPYSGPASAYGVVGKTEARFFSMINDEGGINGRKITFLSYDDGYSPPKTVEQARRLVESDQVLLIFSSLGTPTNTAIHKYMNQKKVPQLFVLTGATKWGDPKHFPWTIGWQANYQSEARIYAAYILEHHSGGKVGVLYQNDDYGKDYLKGVKDGLGAKAKSMIVAEAPYETADTTVDSQIVALKAAGADILVDIATPKFAAQAIRKIAELGWQPVHILNVVGASVGATLKTGRLGKRQGHTVGRQLQGSDRSALAGRRRLPPVDRVYGQVLSGRRQDRLRHGDRLLDSPDAGPGAETMRWHTDPGKCDEAGGEPRGSRIADAVARDQDQHELDRLLPDQADADATVRW